MSISTELENSVTYLRNARQAILDSGGEISPTAGLKDFAKAINAMPTGDSSKLLKLIDRSITELTEDDLKGLTYIASHAFYGCLALESVVIPDSVTAIGDSAFSYCLSLVSIEIPDSVTLLDRAAFMDCTKLRSAKMGAGICYITGDAFVNCTSCLLYDFSAAKAVPTLYNIYAFSGMNDACKIKVPSVLYDEWVTATNWASYADHIIAV